jgi:ATP-dependent RNA helicase RhlE
MSFQSLNLPEPLLRALKDAGYETPTPIQAQAIPPALEGRDLIGRAQTGTGKTAAFAIPIIVQLMKTAREGSAPHDDPEEDDDEPHRSPPRPPHHPHRKGHDAPKRIVRSLILTPTRELAVQIEESFKAYGKYVNLRILAVYGGVRIDRQLSKLRAGVDVTGATPSTCATSRSSCWTKSTACSTWASSRTCARSSPRFPSKGRRSCSPPPSPRK